ncbi:uncharacterized protein BDR25DRAFT_385675 [Lindgomyces ingoldianus]|uniref:Uncharacterized protein n=1 Tax=Lindgomyces ingoldianus TaxID=673940 RepID=A0ACB6R4V1_9PLEO|nr:uncharacterized protein BDR25DRAFT_385675 [Lindgomyces ingoldianus]KAF2474211.1 hypothetical protein BDR25DRAFT_385675 [Lindgomyces ingoldianus]
MPPKAQKKEETGDSDKGFRWTAENDRKLLILTLGYTGSISAEDIDKFVTAMPGTTFNGVRIRYNKLRVEQRNMHTKAGISVPACSGMGKAAAPAISASEKKTVGEKKPAAEKKTAAAGKGRKRAAKDMTDSNGEGQSDEGVPGKKMKTGKPKKDLGGIKEEEEEQVDI